MRIDKNGDKIAKSLSYRLQFIESASSAQDLLQAHYQILLIIVLKEFIKLNVQTEIRAVLNTQTLKLI